LGSVSQIRPQSVSVWLVVDPALAANDPDADAALEAGERVELGLVVGGVATDEQAASATARVTTRPITERFRWRRRALVIALILPRPSDRPDRGRRPAAMPPTLASRG
jgi:hypothetical protein